jgi:hypothetical protein
VEIIRGLFVLGQPEHGILEREQRPRVDLQGQVEVEGAATAVLGMEFHLPDLAEGVGLDEMPLVVDVKTVVNGVILEIGHVSGHIDDCHRAISLPVSSRYRRPVDDASLLEVLHAAATAVGPVAGEPRRLGPGRDPCQGQYRSDLAADAAALEVLDGPGSG